MAVPETETAAETESESETATETETAHLHHLNDERTRSAARVAPRRAQSTFRAERAGGGKAPSAQRVGDTEARPRALDVTRGRVHLALGRQQLRRGIAPLRRP